jgi:hypothetical protein
MPEPTFQCKKCPTIPLFHSVSELRKHQWAAHADAYKKVRKTLKSRHGAGLKPGTPEHDAWRAKISASRRAQHTSNSVRAYRAKAAELITASANGRMTVDDLLEEFQSQRKFLDDVISLISGMRGQHTKRGLTNE